MDALEKFINSAPNSYKKIALKGIALTLIETGLCHYQFETIHPFNDGNGRVGRMLVTLQILNNGLLDTPLLYISPYIEEHKDEYIDSMFAVSAKGDWTRWLKFFLTTIKESCIETIKTIEKLNELQKKYRSLLHKNSKSMSALSMIDQLFILPVISIPYVAKQCNITYQAAKNTIQTLENLNIIQKVERIKNPKLYWAKEIIDISQGG